MNSEVPTENNVPVRRTARARKVNSRFVNDDVDETYRKLVGRITATDASREKEANQEGIPKLNRSRSSSRATSLCDEPDDLLNNEKNTLKASHSPSRSPLTITPKEPPDHSLIGNENKPKESLGRSSHIIKYRSSTDTDSEDESGITHPIERDLMRLERGILPSCKSPDITNNSIASNIPTPVNSDLEKPKVILSTKTGMDSLAGKKIKILSLKPITLKSTIPSAMKADKLQLKLVTSPESTPKHILSPTSNKSDYLPSENQAKVSFSDGDDDIPLNKFVKKAEEMPFEETFKLIKKPGESLVSKILKCDSYNKKATTKLKGKKTKKTLQIKDKKPAVKTKKQSSNLKKKVKKSSNSNITEISLNLSNTSEEQDNVPLKLLIKNGKEDLESADKPKTCPTPENHELSCQIDNEQDEMPLNKLFQIDTNKVEISENIPKKKSKNVVEKNKTTLLSTAKSSHKLQPSKMNSAKKLNNEITKTEIDGHDDASKFADSSKKLADMKAISISKDICIMVPTGEESSASPSSIKPKNKSKILSDTGKKKPSLATGKVKKKRFRGLDTLASKKMKKAFKISTRLYSPEKEEISTKTRYINVKANGQDVVLMQEIDDTIPAPKPNPSDSQKPKSQMKNSPKIKKQSENDSKESAILKKKLSKTTLPTTKILKESAKIKVKKFKKKRFRSLDSDSTVLDKSSLPTIDSSIIPGSKLISVSSLVLEIPLKDETKKEKGTKINDDDTYLNSNQLEKSEPAGSNESRSKEVPATEKLPHHSLKNKVSQQIKPHRTDDMKSSDAEGPGHASIGDYIPSAEIANAEKDVDTSSQQVQSSVRVNSESAKKLKPVASDCSNLAKVESLGETNKKVEANEEKKKSLDSSYKIHKEKSKADSSQKSHDRHHSESRSSHDSKVKKHHRDSNSEFKVKSPAESFNKEEAQKQSCKSMDSPPKMDFKDDANKHTLELTPKSKSKEQLNTKLKFTESLFLRDLELKDKDKNFFIKKKSSLNKEKLKDTESRLRYSFLKSPLGSKESFLESNTPQKTKHTSEVKQASKDSTPLKFKDDSSIVSTPKDINRESKKERYDRKSDSDKKHKHRESDARSHQSDSKGSRRDSRDRQEPKSRERSKDRDKYYKRLDRERSRDKENKSAHKKEKEEVIKDKVAKKISSQFSDEDLAHSKKVEKSESTLPDSNFCYRDKSNELSEASKQKPRIPKVKSTSMNSFGLGSLLQRMRGEARDSPLPDSKSLSPSQSDVAPESTVTMPNTTSYKPEKTVKFSESHILDHVVSELQDDPEKPSIKKTPELPIVKSEVKLQKSELSEIHSEESKLSKDAEEQQESNELEKSNSSSPHIIETQTENIKSEGTDTEQILFVSDQTKPPPRDDKKVASYLDDDVKAEYESAAKGEMPEESLRAPPQDDEKAARSKNEDVMDKYAQIAAKIELPRESSSSESTDIDTKDELYENLSITKGENIDGKQDLIKNEFDLFKQDSSSHYKGNSDELSLTTKKKSETGKAKPDPMKSFGLGSLLQKMRELKDTSQSPRDHSNTPLETDALNHTPKSSNSSHDEAPILSPPSKPFEDSPFSSPKPYKKPLLETPPHFKKPLLEVPQFKKPLLETPPEFLNPAFKSTLCNEFPLKNPMFEYPLPTHSLDHPPFLNLTKVDSGIWSTDEPESREDKELNEIFDAPISPIPNNYTDLPPKASPQNFMTKIYKNNLDFICSLGDQENKSSTHEEYSSSSKDSSKNGSSRNSSSDSPSFDDDTKSEFKGQSINSPKPKKRRSKSRFSQNEESSLSSSDAADIEENESLTANKAKKSRLERSSSSESEKDALSNKENLEPPHLDLPKEDKPVLKKDPTPEELAEIEAKNAKIVADRLKSFVHLEENLYLFERKKCKRAKEIRRMLCDCSLTKEEIANGEVGCVEDCLNRMLMIECGPRCPLKDYCINRRFQKKNYSKIEVFNAENKGCGIRACDDISSGTFIMEYVGEVFDTREFKKRRKEYAKGSSAHFYFMALRSDQLIDATNKGNISRFINHSCDPNCETQKWTVNGELRIGFFSTKFIAAGEEINFDYRLERYGREPQKCFCGTPVCRGWLGESPEERTKEQKEEDRKKELKDRKKKEEKRMLLEDMDLEEEIEKLNDNGLMNRQDTLELSRLMVRAEESKSRMSLLNLLKTGEPACRRLFLDYHGLKLLWSWMADLGSSSKNASLKLEILKTLECLPITNKTQLTDSRVLSIVERWSKQNPECKSPTKLIPDDTLTQKEVESKPRKKSSDTSEDSDTEETTESSETPSPDENSLDANENSDEKASEAAKDVDTTNSSKTKTEVEAPQMVLQSDVVSFALKLLPVWTSLKEAFRIPKKERIEIMKEHEREVEKDYREYLAREKNADKDRFEAWGNSRDRKRDRRRERRRNQKEIKEIDDEDKGLTKEERREKFAKLVAKQDEERLLKLQQEMWALHLQRCSILGHDPYLTPIFDPTGQFYWDPSIMSWQCYIGPDPNLPVPASYGAFADPIFKQPQDVIDEQHQFMAGAFYPLPQPPPLPDGQQSLSTPSDMDLASIPLPGEVPLPPSPGNSPEGDMVSIPLQDEGVGLPVAIGAHGVHPPLHPPTSVTINLPPKWKIARNSDGFLYFYHSKTRVSQWNVPTPDQHKKLMAQFGFGNFDSASDSDSSSSSSSDSEYFSTDEEEEAEEEKEVTVVQTSDGDCEKMIRSMRGKKRRSDKLVQERVISPILFEDREAARRERREAKVKAREEARSERWRLYKSMKEKRAGGGSSAKKDKPSQPPRQEDDGAPDSPKSDDDHFDMQLLKYSKKQKLNDGRSHPKGKSKERMATAMADNSETARKVKDSFRSRMATYIVSVLNPYRRSDCKQGRIVNTEDFKYLARKLTHFVMVKELKQLPSVEGLECSESVKHKTKEFVRKYMSKYGSYFKRDPNDTKEY